MKKIILTLFILQAFLINIVISHPDSDYKSDYQLTENEKKAMENYRKTVTNQIRGCVCKKCHDWLHDTCNGNNWTKNSEFSHNDCSTLDACK